MDILNPDIWKISDKKYEDTFYLVPIEFNMSILGCVVNGMYTTIEQVADDNWLTYMKNSLPEKEKWIQVMCFLCGAAFAYAVKGGLSYQRASAISMKYTETVSNIDTKNEFVNQRKNMYFDFAKEVHYAKQIKTNIPVINVAINFIEDNIDINISSRDVARACSYSLSGLQHLFAKHTGMTITEYIRKKKTEKACFLLCYTDMSCTKIAVKLSYTNQSYFIRQFKQEYGMTPVQYRKENTSASTKV